MARTGKRLTKAYESVDRDNAYAIEEAVKLIKDCCSSKFDETVEIAMNLGVDPRHADQNVRGVVSLPHGTGKSVRVARSRPWRASRTVSYRLPGRTSAPGPQDFVATASPPANTPTPPGSRARRWTPPP